MRTIHDLMSLAGRVALVTGGAGHIGDAIAGAFAEAGADVAIADCTAPATKGPNDLRAFFEVDLATEAAARGLIARVLARFGRLDILVHCAAYTGATALPGWAVPLGQQTVEAWDNAMRVNTTAALVLTQEARAPLERSGHGSVIFVASMYGVISPNPSLYAGTAMQTPAAYSASKAALIQLGRHLATHFSPAIRVNTISPGGVWRAQPEAFVDRYVERTPLRRMATEEDVKGAAAYLASDLSAYVTGHNLIVDGGWTAW
jgi:NAD(P)-dependent dehydrogenase (short-subunit alcohol dehydrogenase family)